MKKVVRVERVFCDLCTSEIKLLGVEGDPLPANILATFRLGGHEYTIDLCTTHARGLGHRVGASANAEGGKTAKHTRRDEIERPDDVVDTRDVAPSKDGTFSCPECSKNGFQDRRALGGHRWGTHRIKSVAPRPEKKGVDT